MIRPSLQVNRETRKGIWLREYRPTERFAQQMSLEGTKTFSVYELRAGVDSGIHFRDHVASARKSHGPHGACLHLYTAREYAQMRLFLDVHGEAGFALNGREVVSVFAHRNRKDRRASRTLMHLAISLGGQVLNAFDTVLPGIYSLCGFREVARLAWDDAEAPRDWDYQAMSRFNWGRPDVVFMAQTYRPLSVRYVCSYEEGVALQAAALAPVFLEVAR
jgi:hypothetical protein